MIKGIQETAVEQVLTGKIVPEVAQAMLLMLAAEIDSLDRRIDMKRAEMAHAFANPGHFIQGPENDSTLRDLHELSAYRRISRANLENCLKIAGGECLALRFEAAAYEMARKAGGQ